MTPRKANPPPDDPEQSKRFIETAKQIEADESGSDLERNFHRIAKSKSAAKSEKK